MIYAITVYTVDPPPSLGPVADQTIGSDNTIDHLPLLAASTVPGDVLSVTVSTADALPAASYGVFSENSDWFFRFSPSTAGVTSGQFTFTASATGIGGTTNVSFAVTVTEGVVKTPPTIDAIDDQAVLARRRLTIPFTVREADGDSIFTNVICRTANVEGPYGRDAAGAFFFEPTLADALLGAIDFRIEATDSDDMVGYEDFSVSITVGSPPDIVSIAPQTIAYGETNQVTLALMPTDNDDITSTNVAVKTETLVPEGEHTYSNLVFRFVPAAADIGQTFVFTASATDFDGTTNVDFNVTVGLAAPALKHCPVDQWTATSFTANLEAAIPGATSYTLRYVHNEDDGTVVTGYVHDATFPCVVSGLDTTNYVYDVQAKRGATTSAWSNAKSIDLHKYIAPTYAIPMKGAARGSHHETFDGLISSGSAYWYDARTIPGWYAASSSGSMSDVQYSANSGGSSGTGLFSCQVDDEAVTNRALAVKADTQWDEFSFGVMFTNMCKYAVTNLHVSFTAMQFRRYNPISHLYFSYTRSNRLIDYNDPENIWTPVGALDFAAPTQGSSARLYPPTEVPKSADIPFEGVNAIQPGEVIALRWDLDAKSNYPTLGIDDLEVSWRCAWPCHTVIMLQ